MLAGALLGGGTGIVGGVFGATAGAPIFMTIGAVCGFCAGGDIARAIHWWKSKWFT